MARFRLGRREKEYTVGVKQELLSSAKNSRKKEDAVKNSLRPPGEEGFREQHHRGRDLGRGRKLSGRKKKTITTEKTTKLKHSNTTNKKRQTTTYNTTQNNTRKQKKTRKEKVRPAEKSQDSASGKPDSNEVKKNSLERSATIWKKLQRRSKF